MSAVIAGISQHSIDVTWRTTWDVIVVEMADGSSGVGEWSDAASALLARPAMERLRATLSGMDLEAALGWVAGQVRDLPPVLSPARRLRATVLGGLDAALCDLAAQKAGLPLGQWLIENVDAQIAPTRTILSAPDYRGTAVPLYANINRAIGPRTPDEFARQARAAVQAGFTRIKCAPFDFLVGANRVGDGLALAQAVRDEIGDDVELLLDLHGHLQVEEVVATASRLRELRPGWIEDAADLDDLRGLRRVREATGLPIAAGEFVVHPQEFAGSVEAGLIDVVMPDIKHAGGPRAAYRLSRWAQSAGADVSPHNPCGPVGTAHTAALCAALDGALLEYAFGETPRRADYLEPGESIATGRLTVSPTPGLGSIWRPRPSDEAASERVSVGWGAPIPP